MTFVRETPSLPTLSLNTVYLTDSYIYIYIKCLISSSIFIDTVPLQTYVSFIYKYNVCRIQMKPYLSILNLHNFNPRYTVFHFVSCVSVGHVSEIFGRSWSTTRHQRIVFPYDQSMEPLRFSSPQTVTVHQVTLVTTLFREASRPKTSWQSFLLTDRRLFLATYIVPY